MKQRVIGLVVILAVAALAAGIVYQRRGSEQGRRERLVEQFITILPDSLDNDHILEIRQLFYVFYQRADQGVVKPETEKELTAKLSDYVKAGHITPADLIHFMAEVGYGTYKDESKYNPTASVDHPALNPKASMVQLGFDSTQYDSAFWAGYKAWRKSYPDAPDSTFQPDSLPQGR
jgi:hypothetical protein